MKVGNDRDSIYETDWITTHQHLTRPERERAEPHTILLQASKYEKGRTP